MNVMNGDLRSFDVLVPAMDQQHEGLVAVMNALYDRHRAKAGKDELDKLLVKLHDLTVKHFHDEEAYFDNVGFPLANNHRRIHQKLVEDFAKHYEAFVASGTLSEGFFSFLRLWLTSHVIHQKLVEDFTKHYEAFAASGTINKGLFSLLRLWLTSDIAHIDRKPGGFSQQNGAA